MVGGLFSGYWKEVLADLFPGKENVKYLGIDKVIILYLEFQNYS